MPIYTQANRPLCIKTPLGQDVLLLTGFRGHETISQLFDFQVDFLAEATNEIHFDRIIGQNVTVELRLANEEKRYFNGLIKRFSQRGRDETFVHFSAAIVPKLWLLTRKFRSRIFQHLSVPDILRQVLAGLDVSYELSATYYQVTIVFNTARPTSILPAGSWKRRGSTIFSSMATAVIKCS